jgi:hypothetical protein
MRIKYGESWMYGYDEITDCWQDNRSVSTFVIYISGHAVSAAHSKQESVISKPLPPKPGDNQNTNKKLYIAIYNFTPVDDGDLMNINVQVSL